MPNIYEVNLTEGRSQTVEADDFIIGDKYELELLLDGDITVAVFNVWESIIRLEADSGIDCGLGKQPRGTESLDDAIARSLDAWSAGLRDLKERLKL